MNKRVTGIGGIFFKAQDPKKITEWYALHLGIDLTFQELEVEGPPHMEVPLRTAWTPVKENTAYFSPSEKPFMFNFRVENLEDLLKTLKEEGVQQIGKIEQYSSGKFAWIIDPENNKIELWEQEKYHRQWLT